MDANDSPLQTLLSPFIELIPTAAEDPNEQRQPSKHYLKLAHRERFVNDMHDYRKQSFLFTTKQRKEKLWDSEVLCSPVSI